MLLVTGILCSTTSHTAQAIHSSHKQPLLAVCKPPFFSLQLLSLPELLPLSHPAAPPICPCYAEQQGRADSATAAANESTATSSCCMRTGIPACGGKPDTTDFLKNIEHPSGHTDLLIPTKPSLGHCFASFCSLEEWNSSGACNLCCFSLSRWSA